VTLPSARRRAACGQARRNTIVQALLRTVDGAPSQGQPVPVAGRSARGTKVARHARSAGAARRRCPPDPVPSERSNNIVRYTEFDRGGHFAYLTDPDLVVGDLRVFFADLPR
jgi:hypothetical protein